MPTPTYRNKLRRYIAERLITHYTHNNPDDFTFEGPGNPDFAMFASWLPIFWTTLQASYKALYIGTDPIKLKEENDPLKGS